jgi:hypothetical protein
MLKSWTCSLACIALATAAGFEFNTKPHSESTPTFEEMATSRVADLQGSVSVVKADQSELRKISRDFALAYQLRSFVMRFKQPDKLRMEGRIGLYIVNGPTRFYSVPQLGLKKKDDLGAAPGKRYSLLEVGLISKNELASTQGKFLRTEPVDGATANVFDVSYRGDETVKYTLWIDARTHVILKREWYDGAGKLKATFRYQDVKELAPGMWFPERIEISNSDGILAGITSCTEVKINQGLDDSYFQIS